MFSNSEIKIHFVYLFLNWFQYFSNLKAIVVIANIIAEHTHTHSLYRLNESRASD